MAEKSLVLSPVPLELMRQMDPQVLQSMMVLQTGEIPAEAIKEHPGKGGRVFKYVSHIWATEQLRNALGQFWSMNVKDADILEDGSASAVVELVLHIPMKDGSFFTNTITEVGAFDGGGGKMTRANMIAAAVSRGLVRCMLRRFGVGQQFYEDEDEEMTPAKSWTILKKYGMDHGLTEEEIIAVIKSTGLNKKALVDQFVFIYEAVGRAIQEKKLSAVPEELGE